MIDTKRKLLLVHIARSGGTSVELALVGKDWWHIDPATKHITASEMRRHYGEEIWQTYTKFAIVRNPWDRFVSMWTIEWWYEAGTTFKGVKPSSFREFLENVKPHPHELYNTLHQHHVLDEKLDYILKFESLQHDFTTMLSNIGESDIVLPFSVKSVREDFRSYYTEETAQIILKTYAEDFARFGYSGDLGQFAHSDRLSAQIASLKVEVNKQSTQIELLNKEHASLLSDMAHLQAVVDSAHAWQRRPWFKRAFSRWHGPQRPTPTLPVL